MRKQMLRKIREQGGPSCKLFWSDIGEGQSKNRSIAENYQKNRKKACRSGGGVGKTLG